MTPRAPMTPQPGEALREAVSLIEDALRVQREGCDHKGIGKPGCGTCDPRIFTYRERLAIPIAGEGLRHAISLLENYGDHHEWCARADGSAEACTCGLWSELEKLRAALAAPVAGEGLREALQSLYDFEKWHSKAPSAPLSMAREDELMEAMEKARAALAANQPVAETYADWHANTVSDPSPVFEVEGHDPHRGNHIGYACGFSAAHCWGCNEPWPCRASRKVAANQPVAELPGRPDEWNHHSAANQPVAEERT